MSNGLTLIDEAKGHPSFEDLLAESYQIFTFEAGARMSLPIIKPPLTEETARAKVKAAEMPANDTLLARVASQAHLELSALGH